MYTCRSCSPRPWGTSLRTVTYAASVDIWNTSDTRPPSSGSRKLKGAVSDGGYLLCGRRKKLEPGGLLVWSISTNVSIRMFLCRRLQFLRCLPGLLCIIIKVLVRSYNGNSVVHWKLILSKYTLKEAFLSMRITECRFFATAALGGPRARISDTGIGCPLEVDPSRRLVAPRSSSK